MYPTKTTQRMTTVKQCDLHMNLLFIGSLFLGAILLLSASLVSANNTQSELLDLMGQDQEQADILQSAPVKPTKASYLAHAEQLLEKQQYAEALDYYTKVIRMDRQEDNAFLGRSIAYSGVGRVEDAIADLNVYILRNPNHSMAHVYRGIRYMSQGDFEYAETNLLKAIRLNPRNARAYDDLGVLYAQTGNLEHALKYFGQALRLDPYNETAYHNLAIAYFLLEDNKRALGAVNRAIKLTPESRDTYILKAQILDALGQIEEAKKVRHYAKFLQDGAWTDAALN